MQKIRESLSRLKEYVERHDFTGYDVYDGLKITNSSFLLKNHLTNTAITQFFKLSPVNLRPLFRIKPTKMPKAAGLFLDGYSYINQIPLFRDHKDQGERTSRGLFRLLAANAEKDYSGICWGFGFNYRFMFKKPTVVITSIIARGLHNWYKYSHDPEVKKVLISISDFILNDLLQSESEMGTCFSYTPIKKDCCFNASMLAAETLARVFAITRNQELLPVIKAAVNFTLAYQKEDGRWNYSVNLETGKERNQVDFHQGYILESLSEIIKLAGLENEDYREALERGTEFYRYQQFFNNGRSLWRWPKRWPVDIHNQAQGIITFVKLADLSSEYLEFAEKIAHRTIDNMQDETGYFYFRKNPFFKNKISYMRWSNAWMFLALSKLLFEEKKE